MGRTLHVTPRRLSWSVFLFGIAEAILLMLSTTSIIASIYAMVIFILIIIGLALSFVVSESCKSHVGISMVDISNSAMVFLYFSLLGMLLFNVGLCDISRIPYTFIDHILASGVEGGICATRVNPFPLGLVLYAFSAIVHLATFAWIFMEVDPCYKKDQPQNKKDPIPSVLKAYMVTFPIALILILLLR